MLSNNYEFVKRAFDLLLSIVGLLVLSPVLIITAIAVKSSSPGPVLYWSKRVGINNEIFLMPKFRSMKTCTPNLATHLLNDSQDYLTPTGNFIRKSSIDELPQLYCILKGDMSLVGPRPALYNQYDLIHMRTLHGVEKLVPGLTGLAQVSGRDELSIELKTEMDTRYAQERTFLLDIKIIVRTIVKSATSSGVSH